MGISSINIAMGASYGAYNQKLTQQTRNQLIELGISFDPNITEQAGQALLRKAQSSSNAGGSSLSDNNSSSKNHLFERASKLAKQLGIEVGENTTLQQLLNLIEQKLEAKIAANEDNIEVLKQLKSLSQELASLQAQSSGGSGYDSTNQALMKSLEVLSLYNQNFLHR